MKGSPRVWKRHTSAKPRPCLNLFEETGAAGRIEAKGVPYSSARPVPSEVKVKVGYPKHTQSPSKGAHDGLKVR